MAKMLYRLASRARNPSLTQEYERLKTSEFLSLDTLTSIQFERTKTLLKSAENNSPFYRQRFRKHGLTADRFTSVADLSRLPIVTKADLIKENRSIRSTAKFQAVFSAETSGTTGEALRFPKSELWDSTVRAHVMRAYEMFGVNMWDKNGYLWGYDISPKKARKIRVLDSLQNRFRLFAYDEASIAEFARRLSDAVYVGGYSSMIFEVAKMMNRLGLRAPQLKMVKGTSETILDAYHAESVRAFGRRIVSEYGAAEAGLIAFECPAGSMHVNIEDVVLEVLEDGSAVVTNLASHSFPIVRYHLGDAVTLSKVPCSCGRNHPVLQEVMGRRGGTVVGRTGRYPALTFYYVFKNIAVNHGVLMNYRVIQKEAGKCEISIEDAGNAKHEALLHEQLASYFAGDVKFQLFYVSEFQRGKKKAQYFETLL